MGKEECWGVYGALIFFIFFAHLVDLYFFAGTAQNVIPPKKTNYNIITNLNVYA